MMNSFGGLKFISALCVSELCQHEHPANMSKYWCLNKDAWRMDTGIFHLSGTPAAKQTRETGGISRKRAMFMYGWMDGWMAMNQLYLDQSAAPVWPCCHTTANGKWSGISCDTGGVSVYNPHVWIINLFLKHVELCLPFKSCTLPHQNDVHGADTKLARRPWQS